MQVRDEDEEVFEMNPIEYIRRDIEGGDSDTRRRSAADLVKALTDVFEAQVTGMFTGYVGALLQVRLAQKGTRFILFASPIHVALVTVMFFLMLTRLLLLLL